MLWFKLVSMRLRSTTAIAVSLFAACLGAGGHALAQPSESESLNYLVLSWIQGNYATPLVCKIEDASVRGLRRILIDPPDEKKQAPQAAIRFIDLEVEEATRCFTDLGGDTPNIIGQLVVRHPITKLRATARRDFKLELRRKRGFDLDIVSGSLAFEDVGPDAAPPSTIDFRGGKFRIHILRQGSDGLRLLSDLPSPRKVLLEFETRDGRLHSFAASLSNLAGASGPRVDPRNRDPGN